MVGTDAEVIVGGVAAKPATFFGEPVALGYLAFTEAWERFSYYGMSALVVLYMTEHLLLPGHVEHVAGFAALTTLIEGAPGRLSAQALASIIYGFYSGLICFTPLFGGLLADRMLGARATVILFNIGINTGAVAGPIVCGLLAQIYGWHVGFGVAAAIMLTGLVTYLAGLKHLPKDAAGSRRAEQGPPLSAEEWRTIGLLTFVIALTVFQSIAYYQIGNAGMIWVRRMADPSTPLGPLPTAWVRSLDSFVSVILAAPLIGFWRGQAKRAAEPSDYAKLGYGAAIAAASALLLALGSLTGSAGRISPFWPAAAFAGMGIAFLYYWPTLMALVSRRAPARTGGAMLGVIFLSLFVAKTTMGWIGSLYETMSPTTFWSLDAAIAGTGALLIFALSGVLAKRC